MKIKNADIAQLIEADAIQALRELSLPIAIVRGLQGEDLPSTLGKALYALQCSYFGEATGFVHPCSAHE